MHKIKIAVVAVIASFLLAGGWFATAFAQEWPTRPVHVVIGFAPGGSVRFNAASARSISMSETFSPPLVIGYLGFDVPILTGGEFGRPIPTHALLTNRLGVEATGAAQWARRANHGGVTTSMYNAVRNDPDPTAQGVRASLDHLNKWIPNGFVKLERGTPRGTFTESGAGLDENSVPRNFPRYQRYAAIRDENAAILKELVTLRNYIVLETEGKYRTATEAEYTKLSRRIESLTPRELERDEVQTAREALFKYYQLTTPDRP